MKSGRYVRRGRSDDRGITIGSPIIQALVVRNRKAPGWHGFVERWSQWLAKPTSGAQEGEWFILLPEDQASAGDPTVHHNGRWYRIRFVPAGTPGAVLLDGFGEET